MSNILPFPTEKTGNYLKGIARCSSCGHEWQAVSPVGMVNLECPSCYVMTGSYLGELLPPEGVRVLHCGACNNTSFYYTEYDELLCQKCGFANIL